MTIALPAANGRLHKHFGGGWEFTFAQADPGQRKILNERSVVPPSHAPGLFPRWVRARGAEVVITGGTGWRAPAIFAQQGITVRAGTPAAPVGKLAAAFWDGRLTATPQGCEHHGHHHDHESHHHHNHDATGENPTALGSFSSQTFKTINQTTKKGIKHVRHTRIFGTVQS